LPAQHDAVRARRHFTPIASFITAAIVLSFAAAMAPSAFGAFSFDSTTVGIGNTQSSKTADATADSATKVSAKHTSSSELIDGAEQSQIVQEDVTMGTVQEASVSVAAAAISSSEIISTASASTASASSGVIDVQDGTWGTGVATWYTDPWAGYGVASKDLPKGTQVQFYYQGKTVICTVDDYGPASSDRDFDLDADAAAVLGYKSAGVVTLYYRVIS
jgi:rare lipoprotein A (peptidoglycan hydrolase)